MPATSPWDAQDSGGRGTCRVALVGCGDRAVGRHLPHLLEDAPRTELIAICDPDPSSRARAAGAIRDAGGLEIPHFESLDALLARFGSTLDAVVIASPPRVHADQIRQALDHELDVLVEKPATISTAEAEELLSRASGRSTVVVAFQGSLGAERTVLRRQLAADGCVIGSVTGVVWEDWNRTHRGTWRHDPTIAGGGFVYDSGLHLIAAVIDIVGPLRQVRGWLPGGRPGLELRATLQAVAVCGSTASLSFDGDVVGSDAGSELRVLTNRGVWEIGVWGKYLRRWQSEGIASPVDVSADESRPWQRFMEIRRDPDPPSGLLDWLYVRDAYEAFLASARQGGMPVLVANRANPRTEDGHP